MFGLTLLLSTAPCHISSTRRVTNLINSVADLIGSDTGSWKQTVLQECFSEEEWRTITSLELQTTKFTWTPMDDSLSKAHTTLLVVRPSFSWAQTSLELKPLWKAIPVKLKVFVWRVCQEIIPTRERLLQKGYQGETHRLFVVNYRKPLSTFSGNALCHSRSFSDLP